MNLFWRIYIPIAALLAVCFPLTIVGQICEDSWFPVRIDQSITNVERTDDRICWNWNNDKIRDIVADKIVVTLDTDNDQFVSSVFEKDTLMPWARSRAVHVGHHVQQFCVTVPPHLKQIDRIVIKQTVYYHGFLGLWPISTEIPVIVTPPDATKQ